MPNQSSGRNALILPGDLRFSAGGLLTEDLIGANIELVTRDSTANSMRFQGQTAAGADLDFTVYTLGGVPTGIKQVTAIPSTYDEAVLYLTHDQVMHTTGTRQDRTLTGGNGGGFHGYSSGKMIHQSFGSLSGDPTAVDFLGGADATGGAFEVSTVGSHNSGFIDQIRKATIGGTDHDLVGRRTEFGGIVKTILNSPYAVFTGVQINFRDVNDFYLLTDTTTIVNPAGLYWWDATLGTPAYVRLGSGGTQTGAEIVALLEALTGTGKLSGTAIEDDSLGLDQLSPSVILLLDELVNKADRDLQNIPTDLTQAQQSTVRERIGVPDQSWGVQIDTELVPELNQDAISVPRIVLEDSGLTHYLKFLDWTAANLDRVDHLPVGGHIGLRQGVTTRILRVEAVWNTANNRYQVANLNTGILTEASSGTDTQLLLTVSDVEAEVADKADTDLQNIDDDLTLTEQATIRERLGLQLGGFAVLRAPASLTVGTNWTATGATIPGATGDEWVRLHGSFDDQVPETYEFLSSRLRELTDVIVGGTLNTAEREILQFHDGSNFQRILVAKTAANEIVLRHEATSQTLGNLGIWSYSAIAEDADVVAAVVGKADTDLQNIDSDLTAQEKATVRERLSIPSGFATLRSPATLSIATTWTGTGATIPALGGDQWVRIAGNFDNQVPETYEFLSSRLRALGTAVIGGSQPGQPLEVLQFHDGTNFQRVLVSSTTDDEIILRHEVGTQSFGNLAVYSYAGIFGLEDVGGEVLLDGASWNWDTIGPNPGDAGSATVRLDRALTDDDDGLLFSPSIRFTGAPAGSRTPLTSVDAKFVKELTSYHREWPGLSGTVNTGSAILFWGPRDWDLDGNGGSRWNLFYSGSLISTLSAAASIGDTTLTMGTTDGIAAGDAIFLNGETVDVVSVDSSTQLTVVAITATHSNNERVFLHDGRGFFFTQSHASQGSVADIEVLLLGATPAAAGESGQEAGQGLATATSENVTLVLYTREIVGTTPVDPTVTWGDEGYGTQNLGIWKRDEDDVTSTGVLWIATATAYKSADDENWTQTGWVKRSVGVQRQYAETDDPDQQGSSTKTDDSLFQRIRIDDGSWSDWFPIGERAIRDALQWKNLGARKALNTNNDPLIVISNPVDFDVLTEVLVVVEEFSSWPGWAQGTFYNRQEARWTTRSVDVDPYTSDSPATIADSLYCQFVQGEAPVIDDSVTDTGPGNLDDVRFRLQFQRREGAMADEARQVAQIYIFERGADWVWRSVRLFAR